MDDTTLRTCSDCGTETLWAAPPCEDGHEDCPDLMCLDCGAATTGGWALEAGAGTSPAVPLPMAA